MISITSPVIKSVHKVSAGVGVLFLLIVAPFQPILIPVPFILVCLTAGKLAPASGALLAAIWTLWLCFCFLPLFLYFQNTFCLFVVYSPALVFLKHPSTPSSKIYMLLLDLVWDIPQLMWIRAADRFSIRAVQPFYSPIIGGISVGSLPLATDVELLASHGVSTVINMCREYPGPIAEYDKHGIKQHWFPTPDLSEPEYSDIERATTIISERKLEDPEAVVFIHCKGGRGRAVSVALCYFVKQGMSKEEAAEVIQQERSVADVSTVCKYKVVDSFVAENSLARSRN